MVGHRPLSELGHEISPCLYCTTEPETPCAECGRRGVKEPMPEAPWGFVCQDARQRYWDALIEDMAEPCLEDIP